MLFSWIPCILFAVVVIVGVPAWCWFAPDEEPSNGIGQEQENQPRRDPDAELSATA